MPKHQHLVLVIYYADRSPLRTAIADHLYAIERYGFCKAIYLNVAIRSVPAWVDWLGVDLIVYDTTVLAQRWHPPTFRWVQARLARLRTLPAVKVALPQDEFIYTDQLCEFLLSYRVDHVLTCAAESDWMTIYGELAQGGIEFRRVLTGYIDPKTVARIERLARQSTARSVDIAYRAWRPEYWLGRHAQLKAAIADAFNREAPKCGLSTDISVREQDTLIGDAWFELLLRARWTIGVEGGASVIDYDGTLRERTQAYVTEHPDADFIEVEQACFPGLDGSLGLAAISPRHLEACATRTAQVLVEGEYNGVLEPGIHYLPLKPDFSNLSDILQAMTNDELRARLADRAYRDVVASRDFEYGALATMIVGMAGDPRSRTGLLWSTIAWWERRLDRPSWAFVAIRQWTRPAIRKAVVRLGLLPSIQRFRARGAGSKAR